ncbi:hypothetical protein GCM10022243_62790 [Saccharothrix violaceirubra]|uniref:Uncharacterized membrane protein YhaH (DUF805 family) n=1 Tax=Saccharothrix violaceirubra TaxID=413306 RepID=A0A7W7SXM4_9PSEU|nr:hypothetical protein [Saccharothrix violaceirubra]MBB4962774.1 uncharacterized membrane protein YhaH (DUF805 family) [Saccharothrix violaceirubra]
MTSTEDSSPATLPVPTEVRAAYWIWIVVAVVSGASALFLPTQRAVLEQAIRESDFGRTLTPEQLDVVVTTNIVVPVVFYLLIAVLGAFFAFQARRGRNWARISLAALTVLSILYVFGNRSVIGLAVTFLAVVAVVLLFMGKPNAFYLAHKRPKF